MKDKIEIFVDRLSKIGIVVELQTNYPWIYLNKVNGKTIRANYFSANHGLVIAYLKKNQEIKFVDLKDIFEIIRLYI